MFLGGAADNRDLSLETGRWVSQHLPRRRYDVVPIHITTDGSWQVPLGSLPATGDASRALAMLMAAVPALPAAQALPRLLSREPDVLFTVLRGPGGDDGSIQHLAQTAGMAAVGPTATTCMTCAHKQACAKALEPVAFSPFMFSVRPGQEYDFGRPVFIKPLSAEGSIGVQRVEFPQELPGAIAAAANFGEVVAQEARVGQELSVTVYADEAGAIRVLPPTAVVPHKAKYFDALAKRRAGRVELRELPMENPLGRKAMDLARDIYELLGGRGVITIDMVASGDALEVLEVNTVPVASLQAPLPRQLTAAGIHPTTFVDSVVSRALAGA